MSAENGHKIRVDAADLTLLEHAEALEVAEPYKDRPSHATYVMAGMVWQLQLRGDPTFTFEQALGLKFKDLDVVGEVPDPEALAASYGGTPRSSVEPGESVPAT
jgi:hypothetical protein